MWQSVITLHQDCSLLAEPIWNYMVTYAFKSNNDYNKNKKEKVLLCYDQGDILLQLYLYRNVTLFLLASEGLQFCRCSRSYVKGYTIVFIFFSFCLCIHCVLKVPFSMVSEFLFIQPSSTKVQLKGNTCPFFPFWVCKHVRMFLWQKDSVTECVCMCAL